MAYNIYLHEQDSAFREALEDCLTQEGWKVAAFKDGSQVVAHMAECPDIWIIDADDEEGFKIIKYIKEAGHEMSIIATSERERVINRVLGLELGCNDFVVKPFLPREMVLRIQRMFAKNKPGIQGKSPKSPLMLQAYSIDPQRRILSIDGESIELTSKEFDLLLLFVRHRGRALSREQIIRSVWGEDYFGTDRAVDDLIRRIRKKVKYLKVDTLYGYGYLVTS